MECCDSCSRYENCSLVDECCPKCENYDDCMYGEGFSEEEQDSENELE